MKLKKSALKGGNPKAPKNCVRANEQQINDGNIRQPVCACNQNTQAVAVCNIGNCNPYFEIIRQGGVPLCLIPSMCGVSRTRVKYLITAGRIQTVSYMGMKFAIWTSLPHWWQNRPGKITSLAA